MKRVDAVDRGDRGRIFDPSAVSIIAISSVSSLSRRQISAWPSAA
jgi:hypothetical protein